MEPSSCPQITKFRFLSNTLNAGHLSSDIAVEDRIPHELSFICGQGVNMVSNSKVEADVVNWMRGPGDHYEIEAVIEHFGFVERTPEEFYNSAIDDVAVCEEYGLSGVSDADEEKRVTQLRHKALVKFWIAASRGIPEACVALGRYIQSELRIDPPASAQGEIFEQVAERWLVMGDRTTSAVSKMSFRMSFKRASRSVVKSGEDDSSSEEIPSKDEDGLIVVPSVGDSLAGEGAQVAKRFAKIVGNTLPSMRGDLPEVGEVGSEIVAQWPWADKVASHLESILQVQRSVGLRKPVVQPMLFVGPPGSGKTALAEKIAGIFGVPSLVIPAGGANDSAGLGAVSRGWSGSRPCGPVMAALQFNCCDPAIIVDELDKAQEPGAKNGSAAGTLLGMMGNPERFQDTCLLENVNLSKMMFMATANSLRTIPEALLDRFTIFYVPRPSAEHFDIVLANAKQRYANSLGVTSNKLPTLDHDEYEVLLRQFSRSDGSLRDFGRAYAHMLSRAVKRIDEEQMVEVTQRLLN